MDEFADLTGGRTYMQDVRAAIAEAVDEDRVGYLIAYHPSPQMWNGKYHKIRLACTRRGVRISTKKGYYACPSEALSADQQFPSLQAAASGPFDSTEIGMRVIPLPATGSTPTRRFRIRMSADDLLWLRMPDGVYADVEAMFVELGGETPLPLSKPVRLTLRKPENSRSELEPGQGSRLP